MTASPKFNVLLPPSLHLELTELAAELEVPIAELIRESARIFLLQARALRSGRPALAQISPLLAMMLDHPPRSPEDGHGTS
jgi:hypothetical protein